MEKKKSNFILTLVLAFLIGILVSVIGGSYITKDLTDKAIKETIIKIKNYNKNERINQMGK